MSCFYIIPDRICFAKFMKTMTNSKNIFLRTFRKSFLILWFALRIEQHMKCWFYLAFFPELPWIEVTYKKAL